MYSWFLVERQWKGKGKRMERAVWLTKNAWMMGNTASCRELNLHCCRAISHLLIMSTCFRDCDGKLHSLHLAETWPLYHKARLALVGSVSMAAL